MKLDQLFEDENFSEGSHTTGTRITRRQFSGCKGNEVFNTADKPDHKMYPRLSYQRFKWIIPVSLRYV